MCTKCLLQVSKIYKFRQMAFESNFLLRQQLKSIIQEPSEPKIDLNASIRKTVTSYKLKQKSKVDSVLIESHSLDSLDQAEMEHIEDDGNMEYVTVIVSNNQSENSEFVESIEIVNSEHDAADDFSRGDEESNDGSARSMKMSMVTTRNRAKNLSTKDGKNRSLECDVCGKILSNLSSFKYHMQLHSDHTPYLCSDCGQGFKTRNAYDGHRVTHLDDNPNKCEICGKTYRQAASLRCHMLKHTGEKVTSTDVTLLAFNKQQSISFNSRSCVEFVARG